MIEVNADRLASPDPVGMAATPHPRVLLVEDDISLLNALGFALEAEGYATALHATAAGALAESQPCGCLVVDLKLPDMDGLALIERLRERGFGAPAILITTDPDARIRLAAARTGVDIVEKPLIGGELRARIAAAIGARGA